MQQPAPHPQEEDVAKGRDLPPSQMNSERDGRTVNDIKADRLKAAIDSSKALMDLFLRVPAAERQYGSKRAQYLSAHPNDESGFKVFWERLLNEQHAARVEKKRKEIDEEMGNEEELQEQEAKESASQSSPNYSRASGNESMGAALAESTAYNISRHTSSLQVCEPDIPLVDLCDSDEDRLDIKPELKPMQADDDGESTDDENVVNRVMADRIQITKKFVALLREHGLRSADLGDDEIEELLCAFLKYDPPASYYGTVEADDDSDCQFVGAYDNTD